MTNEDKEIVDMSKNGGSTLLEQVNSIIDENLPRYIDDLKAVIRQPSIAATGEGMGDAVRMLVEHMESIGFNTRLIESDGAPAVYAEVKGVSPRTLLIYGHYDVQPPDPLDEWKYSPFSAHEVDGRIYGRGAIDDKGNFYCALKAVQSYLEAGERPPVNVKFIIEGEEEVGSVHLADIVCDNRDLLQADALVGMDGSTYPDGRSEMMMGMKGMLSVELVATRPGRDLHSGKASIVPNPAWRLLWALNALKGPDGRIRIPGFYDRVQAPTPEQLAMVSNSGITDEMVVEEVGTSDFIKDLRGVDLLEMLFFDPTCNVSGLSSGYHGPGSKSVLPARASAKLDLRLVPDQDPNEIFESLKQYVVDQGYDDIDVVYHAGMPAGTTSADSRIVRDVLRTLTAVYGQRPVIKPQVDSSGPGYIFSTMLKLPWCIFRLGPAENLAHAPNEYTTVSAYEKGIRAVTRLLWEFGS